MFRTPVLPTDIPIQEEFASEAGALSDSITIQSPSDETFVLTHHGDDGIIGTDDDVSQSYPFDDATRRIVESH